MWSNRFSCTDCKGVNSEVSFRSAGGEAEGEGGPDLLHLVAREPRQLAHVVEDRVVVGAVGARRAALVARARALRRVCGQEEGQVEEEGRRHRGRGARQYRSGPGPAPAGAPPASGASPRRAATGASRAPPPACGGSGARILSGECADYISETLTIKSFTKNNISLLLI